MERGRECRQKPGWVRRLPVCRLLPLCWLLQFYALPAGESHRQIALGPWLHRIGGFRLGPLDLFVHEPSCGVMQYGLMESKLSRCANCLRRSSSVLACGVSVMCRVSCRNNVNERCFFVFV